MTRWAFVGCRDWEDRNAVDAIAYAYLRRGDVMVTGDASGADSMAAAVAVDFGVELVRHHADWAKLGKRAGPERNGRIVADCDRLVAFWDGHSRGTLDAITQAVRAGKPVRIVPRCAGTEAERNTRSEGKQ